MARRPTKKAEPTARDFSKKPADKVCTFSIDERKQKRYTVKNAFKKPQRTASKMHYVVYYRVSTQKQGRTGHGLDAQRRDVQHFIDYRGGTVVAEFQEIESGRKHHRPQLEEALEACRLHRAALLVGTQSRLSRNRAEFFHLLDESGIPIEFADDPHGSPLSIGVKALAADDEARLISRRTREALASAKAKGVKLGSSREGHWTPARDKKRQEALARGRETAMQQRSAASAEFRARVLPVIQELRDKGLSFRAIVAELEKKKIPPRRADKWTPNRVRLILLEGQTTDEK